MRTALLLLSAFVLIPVFTQAQFRLESAKPYGGGVWTAHRDSEGNYYTTGRFWGTANFDIKGGTVTRFTADSYGDIYLAKYNSNDELLWVRAIYGAGGVEDPFKITTDPFGNVFVVGRYLGTYLELDEFDPLGSTIYNNSVTWDGFIAKYSPNGAFLGVEMLDTADDDELYDVDFDDEGNVYLVGSNGWGYIFKLTNDLRTVVYARPLETPDIVLPQAVHVLNDRMLILGTFATQVDLDPSSGVDLIEAIDEDVFIAEYDLSTGNFLPGSGHVIGGAGTQFLADSEIFGNSVYLAVNYNGSIDLGGGLTFTSNGSTDMFFARFSLDRVLMWAQSIGGVGDDAPYELRVNSAGEMYVCGYISEVVDFNPHPVEKFEISAYHDLDGFLVKFDKDGNFDKAIVLGRTDFDLIDGLTIDAQGRVRFAAYLADYSDIDIDPSSNVLMATGSPMLIDYYEPPAITNIKPRVGLPGATWVTIEGNNFSSTREANTVYFGATRAEVVDASPNRISLVPPRGATYGPVSVTVRGRTAHSAAPFNATSIFHGDFAISFSTEVEIPLVGAQVGKSAIADLDGDGRPDIVVPDAINDQVIIFQNGSNEGLIGSSSFNFIGVVPVGDGPTLVVLEDIDGDGWKDIITGNADGTVSILRNLSSSGTMDFSGGATTLAASGEVTSVAVQDLNFDRKPEIIAGTVVASIGTLDVFENESGLTGLSFTLTSSLPIGPCRNVVVANVDGNSNADLVAVDNNGSLYYYRNITPGGGLSAVAFDAPYTVFTGTNLSGLSVTDLNGDGLGDFVVGNADQEPMQVLINTSTGGVFSVGESFEIVANDPRDIEGGDINGDGRPDLIVTNRAANGVTVFLNNYKSGPMDASAFNDVYHINSGGAPLNTCVVDMDRDGVTDLVIFDNGDNAISIYRNLNAVPEPPDQPTDLIISEVTSHSLLGSFTPAAGAEGYLVVRKEGEEAAAPDLNDGVSFSVGSILSDGSVVVYSGSRPYFNCSGLENSHAHTFSIYSFNGARNAINYNTESPLTATVYMGSGTSLHSPYFGWAKHIGGTGSEIAHSIAVGDDGSICVTGEYDSDDVDFDPGPGVATLPKTGSGADAFVAQYSANGELMWVHNGSSTGHGFERGEGIDVDAAGNVYVMGRFTNDIMFWGALGSLTSNGGEDVFLAKYDRNGVFQWGTSFGGPWDDGESYRNALYVDDAGNVYITGEFQQTVTFGASTQRTSNGGRDIYVAQFSASTGELIWVRQIGGVEDDLARDLAVDNDGNVVILGQVNSPVIHVEGTTDPLLSNGATDIALVKYNINGDLIWAHAIGGPVYDFGESVAVDETGAVYITGAFRDHADFGGTLGTDYLNSDTGADRIMLARYDAAGALDWAKSLSLNSPREGYGIRVAADGVGSVYVYGVVRASLNADGNSGVYHVEGIGNSDNILYRYSYDGFLRWAGVIGGPGDDDPADIAVTPTNEIVITGFFDSNNLVADPIGGSISFDAVDGKDFFIAKFANADVTFSSVPFIDGFSPLAAGPGQVVTITGGNFDPDLGNNIVYFGAVRALVTGGDDNELQVIVPIGATYAPISVTTRGLTARSSQFFISKYAAGGEITPDSFDPLVQIPLTSEVSEIQVADFNNDQRVDLAVLNLVESRLLIYANHAEPGSIGPSSFLLEGQIFSARGFAIGDVDGDGQPDMVVLYDPTQTMRIHRSNGEFTFDSPVTFDLPLLPTQAVVADLDLDGRNDVIVFGHDGGIPKLAIFQNRATLGTITPSALLPPVEITLSGFVYGFTVADMDGDGRPDILIADRDTDTMTLFTNNTSPGVIESSSFVAETVSTGAIGPGNLAAGDLDLDGTNDVVVLGPGTASLSVMRKSAAPFDAPEILPVWSADAVALHDMTGDGRPDIVVAKRHLFENRSTSGSISSSDFQSIVEFDLHSPVSGVIVADFDSDGKPDIVFGEYNSGLIKVYRNNAILGAPTIPASNIVVDQRTSNSVDFLFTPGDGFKHMSVMKQGSAIDAVPVDNQIYEGTGVFGTGSDLGNENYVVALGEIDWTSVTVDGLSPATQYTVAVFEYNDNVGYTGFTTENASFLTDLTGVTGNPVSFYTLDEEPALHPELAASVLGSNVTLTFTSPADVGADGYLILRREDGVQVDGTGVTDGMDETELPLPAEVTVVATINDVNATTYSDGGLIEGTLYTYALIPFNWASPIAATRNYLVNGELATASATPSGPLEPLVQTADVQVLERGAEHVVISFVPGDGNRRLIVMREGGAVSTPPVDGEEYIGDFTLYGGTALGDGNFVVGIDESDGSSVTITGLSPGILYGIAVFEFNDVGGVSGTTTHLANFLTTIDDNTASFISIAPEPGAHASNFTAVFEAGHVVLGFDAPTAIGVDGYLILRREGADPTSEGVLDGVDESGFALPAGTTYVAMTSGLDQTEYIDAEALGSGTTYHYALIPFNGAGETVNYKTDGSPAVANVTLPLDVEIPVLVSNKSDDVVNLGDNAEIRVEFSDESGVASVDLVYFSYTVYDVFTIPMTQQGNDWVATLSPSDIGEIGVVYGFVAEDNAGNSSLNVGDGFYYGAFKLKVFLGGTGLTIPYSSFGSDATNYRIIAVPLKLNTNTAQAVFHDDLGAYDVTKWRLWQYQNGTFGELSSASAQILPGRGYFLIVKNNPGQSIDTGPGEAVDIVDDLFTINLSQGWNLIGNPFNFTLDWSRVIDENPDAPNEVQTYTGAYSASTHLNPMQGAFVFVDDAMVLNLPSIKIVPGGRESKREARLRNALDAPEWDVDINVEQGNLKNAIAGIGMRTDASADFDRYDGVSLPRFTQYLELNHSRKTLGYHHTRDVVPTSGSYVWEFTLESSDEDGTPVTLSWDNSYFGNSKKGLILWDVNLELGIDMSAHNRYVFDPAASGNFKVFFGDPEFVQENTRVNSLVFHHITPNPVKGHEATFSFTLPDAEHVSLELIDITGKTVSTVFEGGLEGGYHEVRYETSRHRAGVYVARIRAGRVTAQKKLVLNH